jgi:hypothetical protein
MLTHLESEHNIKRSDLPVTFFGTPPELCGRWPAFTGPIESYQFIVPLVADHPEASPYTDIISPGSGNYDILEEDERDAEIMSVNASYSRATKGKQRAEADTDILLATNQRTLTAIGASTTDIKPISFHAALREPPKKADLSYPLPYKNGDPVVPRRPPPVLGNYFRMRETLLPTLNTDKND